MPGNVKKFLPAGFFRKCPQRALGRIAKNHFFWPNSLICLEPDFRNTLAPPARGGHLRKWAFGLVLGENNI